MESQDLHGDSRWQSTLKSWILLVNTEIGCFIIGLGNLMIGMSQLVYPDVQKIPSHMNMAGVKLREAQVDQEDSSWLTNRIKDPIVMAIVCL
jgi:hypothetical protein